jgi:hypothetical protein
MAISNLTNFITKAAFPAFLIPSGFRRKHENISRSLNLNNDLDILVSAQNASVFQMLTKSYRFSFRDDLYEDLNPLGICCVVSVVINSDREPELGLCSDDSGHPDFFVLSDLVVGDEVLRIN